MTSGGINFNDFPDNQQIKFWIIISPFNFYEASPLIHRPPHRMDASDTLLGAVAFCSHTVQGGPKIWHIFVRLITSSNTNQFSNFFHYQNQKKIVITPSHHTSNVLPCEMSMSKRNSWKKTSVTTHLKELTTRNNVVSSLLYKVTITSCCFTSNVQCARVAAKRRTLGLFCYRSRLVFSCFFKFEDTGILQGSVATHVRCRGIFSNIAITNFLLILTVKKVRKLVKLMKLYNVQNVPNFWPPCIKWCLHLTLRRYSEQL